MLLIFFSRFLLQYFMIAWSRLFKTATFQDVSEGLILSYDLVVFIFIDDLNLFDCSLYET